MTRAEIQTLTGDLARVVELYRGLLPGEAAQLAPLEKAIESYDYAARAWGDVATFLPDEDPMFRHPSLPALREGVDRVRQVIDGVVRKRRRGVVC